MYREWNGQQDQDIEDSCCWAESRTNDKAILIAGDFNIDPSRLEDPFYHMKRLGRNLLTRMENAGLERTSFGKTFNRTVKDKEVTAELDWVLSSDKQALSDIMVTDNALSDHYLLTWTYQAQ